MRNQLLSLFTVLVLSLLGSCKGPDGEPGPQGQPGPAGPGGQNGNTTPGWTYKEGFIKATVAGTADGTPYSYDIDFQGNYSRYETYSLPMYLYSYFHIERYYSGEGSPLESGYASIQFDAASLNDLSNSVNHTIVIRLSKDLGNNKVHSLHLIEQVPNSTLSNVSYDANTGILTGNFSINIPANSVRGPISVTNGSFAVKMVNFVGRKAAD